MDAEPPVMLRSPRGRQPPPEAEPAAPRRNWLAWIATATGVGMLTGFFGVGGGFAVVPALVLVLGVPMPVAVGTSLLVIIINCLAALATRVAAGTAVDWPLVLTFSVVAAVGSVFGGRVAGRVPPQRLSTAFALLLIGVAVAVLASTFTADR